MPERLAISLFAFLLGVSLILCSTEVQASGYTWTDEQGVTHFSDEKPANTQAREQKQPKPAKLNDKAGKSFELRYIEICGDAQGLSNASATLIDIYIEKLSSLQRDLANNTTLAQQVRNKLLKRLDSCAPSLLAARKTAQRRESYQKDMHDVLEKKIQRFGKLKELVVERLEQRRASSMARGVEGAKFYSDLKPMGDNPLRYGMTEQAVSRLWGAPMRTQRINASYGEMIRESYPLGIDLYFKGGLLETWGWRR